MRVLDLFSGIGGFSLGLERAGMRTVAFCEIDKYCQRVLARHWPGVPCYDDVTTLTAARLRADGIITAVSDAAGEQVGTAGQPRLNGGIQDVADAAGGRQLGAAAHYGEHLAAWRSKRFSAHRERFVGEGSGIDLICGGFPCQDISVAGRGAGMAGARSGLWSEFARLVGEVRPRYVCVENVAVLLGRGLGRVLGDLAEIGYDAEWCCIRASDVGAPHRRDRVWILAYPDRGRRELDGEPHGEPHGERAASRWRDADGRGAAVADADGAGLAERQSLGCHLGTQPGPSAVGSSWWDVEPNMGRVAHGVPNRVHRLRALGNSLVPQIAELIGRAIMRTP